MREPLLREAELGSYLDAKETRIMLPMNVINIEMVILDALCIKLLIVKMRFVSKTLID